MTDLERVLEVLEYTNKEKEAAVKEIGTLRQIKTFKQDMLEETEVMNAGIISDFFVFKDW